MRLEEDDEVRLVCWFQRDAGTRIILEIRRNGQHLCYAHCNDVTFYVEVDTPLEPSPPLTPPPRNLRRRTE